MEVDAAGSELEEKPIKPVNIAVGSSESKAASEKKSQLGSVSGASFACTDIVVDNSFDDATFDSCKSMDGDGVAPTMEVPPQFLGHFQVCDDYTCSLKRSQVVPISATLLNKLACRLSLLIILEINIIQNASCCFLILLKILHGIICII